MRLTDIPVDRPVATLMLLVALVVIGVVSVLRLPLDFWPMLDEPEIDIEVPFPGSHPLEAMREVAKPIEEELAAIPGIKRIFTRVGAGDVNVEARFDASTNVDVKKMEVREAVERARDRLPDEIGFIGIRGDVQGGINDGGAILQGRISADRNLSESWELLDRRIRRPLERIKGVARVDLYGVEPQEVRIDLDLDALRAHGVDPGEVLATVNAANLDLDLGTLRGDVLAYNVRAVGRFRNLDSIRDLRLSRDGVRIRDVAGVDLREPRLTYGRHLDRRFAIGIDVYSEPTANTVEVNDRLMAAIRQIERDPELRGIRLLVWESAGEQIRAAILSLRNAGVFGGMLAVVVLYVFLRRWRTTLVVAVAIPFSLIVTCAAMFLVGANLNVLSMVGLMMGVGMMVDNAVVVIENIHRLEGHGVPAREAARRGAGEVALAVVAATATTLIVWSWLLFEEPSGMTVQVGAAALPICLAVACSLLISLTFIPLAASRFPPAETVRPGFLLNRVVPAYRAVLAWTFRHRFLALTGLLSLAATAVIPIHFIEKSPEPKSIERFVPIVYDVHDPAAKEVLEEHVDLVEAWVESRKDELGFESMYSWYDERGPRVTTWIYLPKDRLTESSVKALRIGLQEGLPTIPGVTLRIGDQEWWRRGRQGRRMVNVALHGEDPEYLEDLARDVEETLRAIPTVVEVFGPSLSGRKEVRLLIDTERARSLGLSPSRIADAVSFVYRGRRLRRFEGRNGEIELVVGLPEDETPGLVSLADLPLPAREDETVPLSSVAEITLTRTMANLRRVNRVTTQWVSVQFDEEAISNEREAMKVVDGAMQSFRLPDGYSWSWGEWGRNRDDSLNTMVRGVLLSLLVVVLLMAALFESFTQPLAIVITLPLAFFGAFWALWLGGYILDPVSFFGVILLIGIVVNNGIVMVNHVNALRREGRDRTAALIEGCGDRLRPVMMTAITTIFGIVPLLFSAFNIRGAPMGSMAMAIVGGLATSTVFTLLGLPVWYTMVEDVGSITRRLLPRRIAVPSETLRAKGLLVEVGQDSERSSFAVRSESR